MWEPVATNYPPETLPWGIRQPPPRRPPAPPGTGGAVPAPSKPEPQPYTLQASLRECLLHVRSLRVFLYSEDKLRQSATHVPPEVWDHYIATMPELWDHEVAALRASFDYALLRLLRWPKRSPDADHPSTKTRLLHAICEGAHHSFLFQLLEQRSFFGDSVAPPSTLAETHVPIPKNCPEWALEQLPPRSVVRWVMEEVDRALDTMENYSNLERFDTAIAFPLAALTAALPSRSIAQPYAPE